MYNPVLTFYFREKRPQSQTVTDHTHNCYELVYFSKVDGQLCINGNKSVIKPGSIHIIYPSSSHSEIHNTDYDVIFLGFECDNFPKDVLKEVVYNFPDHIEIYNLLNRIINEAKHQKENYSEITSHLLAEIILLMERYTKDDSQSVKTIDFAYNYICEYLVRNKYIENKTISVNENISVEEIRKMVDLINNLLVGTLIDEINKKLEFEIKPIIGKYIKQQEAIYNMFYNAFNEMTSKKDNYHFSGKTNILKAPEFDDANKIRNIVEKLEDSDVISSIEETSSGINVYIGDENEREELKDLSIITFKHTAFGRDLGTIGIIGPKRMNYSKVISIMKYINKKLNENNEDK